MLLNLKISFHIETIIRERLYLPKNGMKINNNFNIYFLTKKQSSSQIQNKQDTNFPPKYSHEGVKDTWQKAVNNSPYNIKSIITRSPFFAAEASTNLKHDSKDNITGRHMLGEAGYQDIFASPNISNKQFGSMTESYSVNISETALGLSRNSKAGEMNTEISYENLPIEAFAFPEWFSKWIPDEAVLGDQVGLSLPNHGIQQSSNYALSGDKIDELGEYVNKLLQYFQEELKNNGIEGDVGYYASAFKNKETSEIIHQAVKNRIFDDLRARELMQSFGKNL